MPEEPIIYCNLNSATTLLNTEFTAVRLVNMVNSVLDIRHPLVVLAAIFVAILFGLSTVSLTSGYLIW